MGPGSRIKAYTAEAFGQNYILAKPEKANLLKANFGAFFIVRVEDMSRLMKLPVPPVRIPNHILLYLTGGEAVMNIGSQPYKIARNECLLVPAGQVFSFDKVEANTGYLCNFHNAFLTGRLTSAELLGFEFLQVWGNPFIGLTGQNSVFVVNLLERLLVDYTARGVASPDLLQSYLVALLHELNEAYQPASPAPRSRAVLITNRFKELLFAHLKTKHRVSDYAALLHFSPNHLNKAVRAVTGKSPGAWIEEAIVLEAKVLLCQSEGPISEIAAQIGLFDPSYFTRLFKKHEGVTPLAFRKKIDKS